MSVKKTGGGTFNPGERGIYFAAGSAPTYPRYVLQAVNDLFSAREEKHLVSLLDAGHVVFLDSGIFWLTNRHMRAHGISMDAALALPPDEIDGFTELFDRYVELVNRYAERLWGYIELDQGGRDAKRNTRGLLESMGLAPIPVYHPFNDGWDYFDELAAGYDRICFGNVVQARQPVRLRLLHTAWERHRQYPDLWIHILGLTANEWCLPFPPDSCDSSSWLNPLRYPRVNTETSMLRRVGQLMPGFNYDMGAASDPARGVTPAAHLCRNGADGMHRVWRHAAGRAADITDQPAHPARLPEEGPLLPCE